MCSASHLKWLVLLNSLGIEAAFSGTAHSTPSVDIQDRELVDKQSVESANIVLTSHRAVRNQCTSVERATHSPSHCEGGHYRCESGVLGIKEENE